MPAIAKGLERVLGEKRFEKLKGMILYGVYENSNKNFYGLGIPIKKNNSLCFSKLKRKIKTKIKEMKNKKDNNELTGVDFTFANELRSMGLVDKNYLMTKKADNLAIDNPDAGYLFDNPFNDD